MRHLDVIWTRPSSDKSRSAYILLTQKMREGEEGEKHWAQDLREWLAFRKEYLQKVAKDRGKLECAYCGRDDLVEGYHAFKDRNRNAKIENLATIDHIVPLSKDGPRYEEENLCVACRSCNEKKADNLIND